jgi:hypothetical protein
MKDDPTKYQGGRHRGPGRSSPYPVSRLAPAIELVDLAREIGEADRMLNLRVSSKLKVIADQIRSLQEEARTVLAEARQDQELNHARCSFHRKPGNTYHLYRKEDGTAYFSMLSPADWRGQPPHDFAGSYRLENDMSWTPLAKGEREDDDTRSLIEHLLAARHGGNE